MSFRRRIAEKGSSPEPEQKCVSRAIDQLLFAPLLMAVEKTFPPTAAVTYSLNVPRMAPECPQNGP